MWTEILAFQHFLLLMDRWRDKQFDRYTPVITHYPPAGRGSKIARTELIIRLSPVDWDPRIPALPVVPGTELVTRPYSSVWVCDRSQTQSNALYRACLIWSNLKNIVLEERSFFLRNQKSTHYRMWKHICYECMNFRRIGLDGTGVIKI